MAWPSDKGAGLVICKLIGGPGFKSSTLPFAGFFLVRLELNSSAALCKWPTSLPPATVNSFKALRWLIYVINSVGNTTLPGYGKL